MKTLEKREAAPASQIMGLTWGARAFQTLKAAVELNIFAALADSPLSAQDVAERLKYDRRGVEVLLNALVSMNLLLKEANKYQLTEAVTTYLLPGSDLSMVDYIKLMDQLGKRWELLPEAVRTGQPIEQVNKDDKAAEFFPMLAEMIFPTSYSAATVIAKMLADVNKGPLRVLDVAAGSGAWSIPFAESNKEVRVDALDFQPVLEVTRKLARRHGVADRYSYLTGNWRDVPWETDVFDIVTLGHILHSEGREVGSRLLKNCFASLKKGGTLIVAEFISNNEKTGPVPAALFALNMFMMTTDGCVFSNSELKQLIEEAGFSNVKTIFDDENSCTVVTAVK